MPGLAVTRLQVSHFRSHRQARLRTDERPVVLFGRNGAGKTNLLEAVSLLSPGRGLRRAAAEDLARRPEAIGWKITAELRRHGTIHEIETWADPGAARSLRIDGKQAPQAALGRIAPMVWLLPSMDRLWTDSAEGRRRFLDRMTLNFEPDHAGCAVDYEKAMRQRNRLLRDQVENPAWYTALEQQMARAGARMIANRHLALTRLAAAQEDARTTFPASRLSMTGPDDPPPPETEDALRSALAQGRRRDMAAGRSLTGPHRADLHAVYSAKGVQAAQCSTGEQKALLVSIILACARALHNDTGVPPILLLDEVAAHLDEDRRAALFEELVAIGAQAWLTGTGRELFTGLESHAQIFELRESADGSTIASAPDST